MEASGNGHHEVLRTLLQDGGDVHAETNMVRNQLMMMMMIIIVLTILMTMLLMMIVIDVFQ